MSTVRAKTGLPLPYELKPHRGEDGKYTQIAVVICCDCNTEAERPWAKQENPKMICEIFERLGWEMYQSKARCPACAPKRRAQRAAFARINNQLKEDTTAMANTIRVVPADHTEVAAPVRQVYLLIIEDGAPRVLPIVGSKEMLFGDDTYLVIPQSAIRGDT